MPDWLNLYHRAPYPLRVLAASAQGFHLRRRRYGRGFAEQVVKLQARQSWTQADWQTYQQETLVNLLRRVVARIPHYRTIAAQGGLHGDPEDLASWPILEKDRVREAPLDFVADDQQVKRLVRVNTSGTTGKPLTIYRSPETEQAWYAMFEVRARNPWGVRWEDRWAILGGRLVVPAGQQKAPFWIFNRGLNQLYLSSYHLSRQHVDAYLDVLAAFKPAYFWAYTSALHALALFALAAGRTDIRPRVVITNAEPLYDHQRTTIAEAFGCPVVETYGMTEMGVGAAECVHRSLHYWPDLGYLELLGSDGTPVPAGETGHVVCSTLLNREQPLIRYRTGDLAVAMPDTYRCPCGSAMPVLARVEGRKDDVVLTRDGRQIGRLDPVFKSDFRIREAQIIQEDWETFTIRYVPAPNATEADGARMSQALKERVGPCQVRLEAVDQIERTATGKFRAVISKVKPYREASLHVGEE